MQRWTRRLTVVAASLVLLLSSLSAWAGERTATIRSVDADHRVVSLEDGTQLWVVEGISLDLFSPGRTVKITYDEKEGKKWIRAVELVN